MTSLPAFTHPGPAFTWSALLWKVTNLGQARLQPNLNTNHTRNLSSLNRTPREIYLPLTIRCPNAAGALA